MKTISVGTLAATLAACAVRAEGDFSAFLGYKYVSGLAYSQAHDTNPGDSFLANANSPGSAGTTSINDAHFGLLGIGWQPKVYDRFHFTLDAALMLGGARSGHQNDNDSRPPEQGAFIYSQAGVWGLYFAPGLEYRWDRVALGVEAQFAGIPFSSGWDRYSSDEEVSSAFKWVATVGPKLAVVLSEELRLEASVQFGNSIGCSLAIRRAF